VAELLAGGGVPQGRSSLLTHGAFPLLGYGKIVDGFLGTAKAAAFIGVACSVVVVISFT
jgi:hypothetical protein